jgi:hypothetical protein
VESRVCKWVNARVENKGTDGRGKIYEPLESTRVEGTRQTATRLMRVINSQEKKSSGQNLNGEKIRR